MARSTILFLSVLLAFVLALGGAAGAAVFNVDTEAELQTALATAASNNQADTINIAAGTYDTDDNGPGATFTYTAAATETYALTIRGAGAATTIIDGNTARPCMFIDLTTFRGSNEGHVGGTPATDDSAATIRVEDLTFQNGRDQDNNLPETGGLEIDTYSASIIVDDCVFDNNWGMECGGLMASSFTGSIDLSDSTASNNKILVAWGENGNGACLKTGRGNPNDCGDSGTKDFHGEDTGDVSVTNCNFLGNASDPDIYVNGGGLSATASRGDVDVIDCRFENNIARTNDSTFGSTSPWSYSAGAGGGLHVHTWHGAATIEDSVFIDNIAETEGGGAHVGSKFNRVIVRNNEFEGNESVGGGGGLFLKYGRQYYTEEPADNDGDGSIVYNDEEICPEAGIAAHGSDGDTIIENNTFVNNTCNSAGGGGGAKVTTTSMPSSDVDIRSNTFAGNTAINDGFWADGTGSEADGGGLNVRTRNGRQINLENNAFEENTAETSGGGASVNNRDGLTRIYDNTFCLNEAESNQTNDRWVGGGGIIIDTRTGTVDVENNSFNVNTASGDGNADGSGGGLFLHIEEDSEAEANILRNIVWNNTAAGFGQDIYVDDINDVDPATDPDGSPIVVEDNDYADFYSLCANTGGCTPDLTFSNNQNVDPEYLADCDLRLQEGSPFLGMNIGALFAAGQIPVYSPAGIVLQILILSGLAIWYLRRRNLLSNAG